MDCIIPIGKLEEALSKELYGVLKEAFLLAENTISKGGKVIIQKEQNNIPEIIQVFEKKEDLDKWFEAFIGYKK